jgi:hypothetical protein
VLFQCGGVADFFGGFDVGAVRRKALGAIEAPVGSSSRGFCAKAGALAYLASCFRTNSMVGRAGDRKSQR